ncbi:hypothetical protein HaLaN_21797, partial [Haematococcus lacustris]
VMWRGDAGAGRLPLEPVRDVTRVMWLCHVVFKESARNVVNSSTAAALSRY